MGTATVEEVVGVIQGLAAVVKEQQATNRDLSAQTQQHIVDLASSVKELSLAVDNKRDNSSTFITANTSLEMTLFNLSNKTPKNNFPNILSSVLLL